MSFLDDGHEWHSRIFQQQQKNGCKVIRNENMQWLKVFFIVIHASDLQDLREITHKL